MRRDKMRLNYLRWVNHVCTMSMRPIDIIIGMDKIINFSGMRKFVT